MIGVAAVSGVGVVCIALTFWMGFHYDLSASYMKFTDAYFEYFYDRPNARVPHISWESL
jgi:hypothetical protein